MNRQQFMREFEIQLAKVPSDDRRDLLYDYQEHFDAAVASGKTEEEITQSLGAPRAIAKEVLAQYFIQQAQSNRSPSTVLRAVFASISLGFFNLVFVLGPFVSVAAVIISLFATAVALILAPLSGLALIATGGTRSVWTVVFAMIAVEGFGLLILCAAVTLAKLGSRGFLRYLFWNVKMIRGDR